MRVFFFYSQRLIFSFTYKQLRFIYFLTEFIIKLSSLVVADFGEEIVSILVELNTSPASSRYVDLNDHAMKVCDTALE